MTEDVKQKIKSSLEQKSVVLFMKGTPSFPQCGFSARSVAILKELDVDFGSVNVLDDEEVRHGIKEYGNWPTIPQLYVNKELVGGSDIMLEMYENGELKDTINQATS